MAVFEVGRKIKKAREYQRPSLTQQELADSVGISRDALAKYETGKNRIPDDVLKSIVKVTGYPLSWFLDGADSPIPAESNAVITDRSRNPQVRLVPYWGEVPCGDWSMPIADPQEIQVSHEIEETNIVCIKVVGDSMQPRFRHGQKVILKLVSQATDGFIHLCRNQDGELTLKVTKLGPEGWELHSINPAYPAVTAEAWEVLGRAIYLEEGDDFGLRP